MGVCGARTPACRAGTRAGAGFPCVQAARFHVHFTPTYGSWINLAERWFVELANKRIRRGVFRSVKELESAIRGCISAHNEAPKPLVWTRTADQILDSIARYAQRTTSVQPD